jgi:hypothetical protein
MALCQGKAPIGHERFVRGQKRLDLLQQSPLQGSFPCLSRLETYAPAGYGQALGPH